MSAPARIPGYQKVRDMPGDGPWKMTSFNGSVIVASVEHGVFRLVMAGEAGAETYSWERIEPLFEAKGEDDAPFNV